MAGVYGDNVGRWQAESERSSSLTAVRLCVTSGEVGSMAFVPSRIVLSTAGTYTLWMLWLSVLALRCWSRGPTPIYDRLRGERINAGVPPSCAISMVTRAGTALMSTCLVLWPWWCGRQVPQRMA